MAESKSIIFYGAGYYAAENINRWEQNGLIPVCFCDADRQKHNKLFNVEVGGYTISYAGRRKMQSPIYFKYIILEDINDNEVDIYAFLKIASKLQAIVILSMDFRKPQKSLSQQEICVVKLFQRIMRQK